MVVNLAAHDHRVNADATRLEQVFWNLIKNAVKLTPAGGTIEIHTWNERAADASRRDLVVVEFVDNGIGIGANGLRWIFDPFHQGDGSITRGFGGMGLGLAISQGVIEAHGGSLTAQSRAKTKGATFRVELQVEHRPAPTARALPQHPPDAVASSDPQPSLRIFLVEDEPMTLIVMARLLQRIGHEVTTASSVQESSHDRRRTRLRCAHQRHRPPQTAAAST